MERLKKMCKHIILRHQHDAITINFDILKNVIVNHIDTENLLLDERNKTNIHINVSDTLKEHKKRHKEILNRLFVLEEDLNEHIKLYDQLHIHRL
tara:strand:- start:221 stop:505 length:285 start_codon:yes stop_codon:yes gene_type:complete